MIIRTATALAGSLLLSAATADTLPGLEGDIRAFQDSRVLEALKKFDLRDLLRVRIHPLFGFHDGSICVAPPPVSETDIDFHRSLFVHDQATLGAADFSLRRVLQKLSDDVSGSAPGTTPESIFRQFWDTQNDAASAVTAAGNPHCSDDDGKVNGFPLNKCPRSEGAEAMGSNAEIASRIDNDYRPLALVNRIDLADKGWKSCGEHRIIFGRQNGIAKNLIIFEAVLPNPRPGCRSGCREVFEFWTDLSNDPDPASRAAKLSNFYFNGLSGFRPVVESSHYSASGATSVYGGGGSGQIRTNQFLNMPGRGLGPWTLKEFKTLLSCAGGSCDYDIMPISVKGNPWGPLWNRDLATGSTTPPSPPSNPFATPVSGAAALAVNFQADVIAQVTPARLGNPDLNSFSYEVDLDKNAAESQSQGPVIDHYRNQFNAAGDATFRNMLTAAASGVGLTAEQVVNRATALSCAGCHQPSSFGLTSPNSIGPGQRWPNALSFVHVDTSTQSLAGEAGFDPARFGGNDQGFPISPALLEAFLPARRTVLTDLANEEVCNCVRNVLTVRLPDLRRRPEFPFSPIPPEKLRLLDKFGNRLAEETRAALAGTEKALLKKETIRRADLEKAFDRQKSILRKAEARMDEKLRKDGVKLIGTPLKPRPVIFANAERPTLKLKTEAVKRLLNSQPPRESITGSFRTH